MRSPFTTAPVLVSSPTMLEAPDTIYLRAAEGWLELGNHVEANEELENITVSKRSHPDVLEIRWSIYAKAKKWNACLEIGNALVQIAPKRSTGWRHRSVALHSLNRTREAYDLLLRALDMFRNDWAIHYDLACYACKLGKLDEARAWLENAFTHGDQKRLKVKVLDDPDLALLWTGF
jgi:tetratricopeptide (TPR) repeat protein